MPYTDTTDVKYNQRPVACLVKPSVQPRLRGIIATKLQLVCLLMQLDPSRMAVLRQACCLGGYWQLLEGWPGVG